MLTLLLISLSAMAVASPDITITNVSPTKTVVGQGFTTLIMVGVENQGSSAETFNVTAYYDGNPILTEQWLDPTQSDIFWSMGDAIRDGYIDLRDVYLIANSFGWVGSPGKNPADINNDGEVGVADVFTCGKNYGKNIWESLGISKIIRDYANVTLPSGYCAIVGFRWNTTGVAKGNYTISAYAGEFLVDGWVTIAMIGDITGPSGYPDGKVDMLDLWEEARNFGIDYPDSRYNPNFDIDDNLKIDMLDIWLVAREFGKIDP